MKNCQKNGSSQTSGGIGPSLSGSLLNTEDFTLMETFFDGFAFSLLCFSRAFWSLSWS